MTTKEHTKSIQDLDKELVNLYKEITSSDMEFNYIYGSDEDTLVVVSNHIGASKEFREHISESILNTLDKPCGFVLSDGPSEYDKYTTAYIRKNPDNSYEYVLAPLMNLVNEEQIPALFHQVSSLSKKDKDDEDARVMAASYLYALLMPDGLTNLDEISSLMGVKQEDVRENSIKAMNRIKDVLYE